MHHSIELVNVCLRLGHVPVLQGVSIEAKPYEFVSVVGANGAGKTTLLKIVNGMLRPEQGTVRVLGQELHQSPNLNALRKEIGLVPQRMIASHFPLRVEEAVLMGRYGKIGLMRKAQESDWEKAYEAMRMVGISPYARKLMHELSGGEQQKVALARALAQDPQILLLDEPTTYLDHESRTEIMKTIFGIHQQEGLTTLMVSHETHWVEQYSHKVYLLKEGKSHLVRESNGPV